VAYSKKENGMAVLATEVDGNKRVALSGSGVEGFVARLDPRTVLWVFPLALTCAFLFLSDPLQDYAFIAYLFFGLIVLRREGFVAKWILVLAVVHTPLFFTPEPSFQYSFLALSARKACMIFSTGLILFTSVSVGDLVAVMKKMKLHKNIIIPVAICFRFVPTLVHETQMIRASLKIRRLYSATAVLRHPLQIFELFLATLLFRMFALGEELNFSLSTRGINFTGNAFYQAKAFSYRDVLFIAATCVYLTAILYLPSLEFFQQ
jgi:energy-coupling factor transport system permease protein